jgi:hypothetical protein
MKKRRVSRRAFLGTAAAATIATQMKFAGAQSAAHTDAWPENGTLIPDEGWRLWVDEKAAWKNDAIFLPEDVTRDASGVLLGKGEPLPVNAPTGGWGVIQEGIAVTLPSTVEQHCWGKFGLRPYAPDEYSYASSDPVPQNGAYLGVSWWTREIEIPASMAGKRIFLHIRGAHLRAEVYLNQKLVGYSIMEELPFEADLTNAANPGGKNLLAIRITNPFGRFDWVDGLNAQWGTVKLYRSHGFGGLDRGMTISAHDSAPITATWINASPHIGEGYMVLGGSVRIKDAWVLNTAEPHTVKAYVELEHNLPLAGQLHFEVVERVTQKVLVQRESLFASIDDRSIAIDPKVRAEYNRDALSPKQWSTTKSSMDISCPDAILWSLESPTLYELCIRYQSNPDLDSRTIAFGFRWFAPEGVGTDAIFRLNGRRTKIYTAISWGFWGLNGMWPTPELAEKEVTQAKKLGLNCLNFHRNLAKEEVLRAHDRLGLLRYMEPGGGKMALGRLPDSIPGTAHASEPNIVMVKPASAADIFAQQYMFTKCVEMVKAYRSHPSVIEYCVQNETGADLSNPDTIAILQAMRAEDPSRCIVLNDGFVSPPRMAAQAWFEPYDAKLHRSDEEPWGGWWNLHQGAGDQWYDEFYKSPTEFTYNTNERKAISEYGEMEGCAVPDNHSLMLHQYADPRGTGIGSQPANKSYDLADHREILAAYDAFLDRWGFRAAFPATERLWLSLGKKCYDSWANYLENARINDALDFCAISGWESTAIENHSGIVDNLRNFKGDPSPITGALMPVRPVAKQRSMCADFKDGVTFDIFLLNNTSKPVAGELIFSVVDPKNNRTEIARFLVPAQSTDQFSYLVKEGVTYKPKRNATVPYHFEGMYRFKLELTSHPLATQTKDLWFTSRKIFPSGNRIAVSGITSNLRKQLEDAGEMIEEFVAGTKYEAIISAGLVAGVDAMQNSGDTTAASDPMGAVHTTRQVGVLADGILDAVRAGTPLLAMPQVDALSDGVAKQLAAAGAFAYNGTVGDIRAPWMGNWTFVRKHAIYDGMPVDQAMGIHYQVKGREANGLLIDRAPGGAEVEIIAAYSRDHSRLIGAGTFTTRLGAGRILFHRVPEMQPVLQARFLANALRWLTS